MVFVRPVAFTITVTPWAIRPCATAWPTVPLMPNSPTGSLFLARFLCTISVIWVAAHAVAACPVVTLTDVVFANAVPRPAIIPSAFPKPIPAARCCSVATCAARVAIARPLCWFSNKAVGRRGTPKTVAGIAPSVVCRVTVPTFPTALRDVGRLSSMRISALRKPSTNRCHHTRG